MAGHSKWAGIKHKKAIVDARRGKLFTKLARAITVAAKGASSGVGWMQLTGQTSTHETSLQHAWVIT